MFVPDALDGYVSEQLTLGLSEQTIRCQTGYLARFAGVCEEVARERRKRSPLKVSEIDNEILTRYFETCKGGEGNRNNMLIPLRKFLTFCEDEKFLESGDMRRLLRSRKVTTPERSPKYYVPVEQFGDLIESGVRHPADRIVMATALYTLGRQSELAGLRLENIDLIGRTVRMYRVKKKRWTDIGITQDFYDELMIWLDWYARELDYGTTENLLEKQPAWRLIPRLKPVSSRNGKGQFFGEFRYEMDPLSPQRHLERVAKRALDYTGAITPEGRRVRHLGEGIHTIRRSGARAMVRHLSETVGDDRALALVATMLDHKDPKTTMLYIGWDQEREQLNDRLRSGSMYGVTPSTTVRRLRAAG